MAIWVATVSVRGDIAGAVRRGIDAMGAIEPWVWPGMQVAVKAGTFERDVAESGKVIHSAAMPEMAKR